MELKLLRKLQENLVLQPTGDATATGEVIITGELMATVDRQKNEVFRQSLMAESTLRGIAALFAGRPASSSGSPLCMLGVLLARA